MKGQKTEQNNETTTSLACEKERGLTRARLKNAFDSREKHGRVFKTRVLAAACKHEAPANGVNLEEISENRKKNAATYKSSEYTSHGMLKFSEENRGRNRYNVEMFLCAYYISAGQTSLLQVQ